MSLISQINLKPAFPLAKSPLVHCITNDISLETVANALLYVGAKPFMADYPVEFADVFVQTDAVLLNLGHLSAKQVEALQQAATYAKRTHKPTVLDVVGISATTLRAELAQQLLEALPAGAVVKGNFSEMRTLAGLPSHGRGVDNNPQDQATTLVTELANSLSKLAQDFPQTIFLATGATDLVVTAKQRLLLHNGVPELDRFTGSGDIVGALIAAVLGDGQAPLTATLNAVSYLNLCGQQAAALQTSTSGLATFRHLTLDQLSLIWQDRAWANSTQISELP
ncbi:hydroxyethylthiazole kinase [Ligilactobacillus pabuli]|uniref:Hydroxyethylthiazole kinase n=1 Tax=Ligilactobacillus pabuli TaxID=2886039 RepID=A0ABQ5JID8_9LACO|nr:hydroxyethylthiazole kinase [Ligilactobacillus pabuli]GKS81658.1 hydroxyethylthiazole kinase [Ligilactobacillus pabuli]